MGPQKRILKWRYEDHKEAHIFGSEAYWFDCPGCKSVHVFTVGFSNENEKARYMARRADRKAPVWQFNGNMFEPSFYPSMSTVWTGGQCHFFVTNGFISFCHDSSHDLKGKTVALPGMRD